MNFIWINNMEQANFYMVNGAIAKSVNQFPDGKVSIAFTKEDTKHLYYQWLKIKGLVE